MFRVIGSSLVASQSPLPHCALGVQFIASVRLGGPEPFGPTVSTSG